jgi:hypothetical protein
MITVNQEPGQWTAAFSEMIVTATSTDFNQSQYSMICDVYAYDVVYPGGRLMGSLYSPAINAAVCVFDISGLVSSALNPQPDFRGLTQETSFYTRWRAELREQWDITGGMSAPVIQPGTTIIGDDGDEKYSTYGSEDPNQATTGNNQMKFLLSQPRYRGGKPEINVRVEDVTSLFWVQPDTNRPSFVRYRAYDEAGLLLQTITASELIPNVQGVFSVPAGPHNINAYLHSLTSGNVIIKCAVMSYDVTLVSAGGAERSEVVKFILDRSVRFEPMRLNFINSLGGIDSLSFREVYNNSSDKTTWNTISDVLDVDQYFPAHNQDLKQTTSVKAEYDYESVWLSQRQQNLVKQLVYSPRVYRIKTEWYEALATDPVSKHVALKEVDDQINLQDLSFSGSSWMYDSCLGSGLMTSSAAGLPSTGEWSQFTFTGVDYAPCMIYQLPNRPYTVELLAVKSGVKFTGERENLKKFSLSAEAPTSNNQWR